jgi:hypothetical protein
MQFPLQPPSWWLPEKCRLTSDSELLPNYCNEAGITCNKGTMLCIKQAAVLTSWSRVFLEKQTGLVAQPVNKFLAFYVIRWFSRFILCCLWYPLFIFCFSICVCIHKNEPLDVILSQMNPVDTLVRNIRSILIFSHLRLVSKVVSSHQGFRIESCMHLSLPSCMWHTHLLFFLVYFTTPRQLHRPQLRQITKTLSQDSRSAGWEQPEICRIEYVPGNT